MEDLELELEMIENGFLCPVIGWTDWELDEEEWM